MLMKEKGEPLSHEDLRETIELSLWAGQLLLQYGADTQRVETTIHRFGTGLGCDWLDIFVSINAIILTTTSGEEFRTKTRRVVRVGGVNMAVLAKVNELSREVYQGKVTRAEARKRLEEIDKMPRHYPNWIVLLLVGLACGGFGRLFGGVGWQMFAITAAAATSGLWVRQRLLTLHINPYFAIVAAAFTATLIGGIAKWVVPDQLNTVFAACVLFLIPGVPLVNSLEDFISGHTVVGLSRGFIGMQISLCIALGVFLAFTILGVDPHFPIVKSTASFSEDIMWAVVAAIGFAVLFNVPPYVLLECAVCGAVGHGLRYGIMRLDLGLVSSVEMATLMSASVVGLISYRLAQYWHIPSLIFGLSGIIPMIPGIFAFGTMLGVLQMSLVSNADQLVEIQAQMLRYGIKTGLILVALAVGLVLPPQIWNRPKPIV